MQTFAALFSFAVALSLFLCEGNMSGHLQCAKVVYNICFSYFSFTSFKVVTIVDIWCEHTREMTVAVIYVL